MATFLCDHGVWCTDTTSDDDPAAWQSVKKLAFSLAWLEAVNIAFGESLPPTHTGRTARL